MADEIKKEKDDAALYGLGLTIFSAIGIIVMSL